MKKVIISGFVLLSFFSCKKNQNADTIEESANTETIDSTATANKSERIMGLNLVDKNQLTQLLAPKNNDTIYVTNFFATWCPPCMREIPHFVEKITELKDKPVKFTFVSVDAKDDWETKVVDFGNEYKLSKNIVLFDASMITPDYFSTITKTWDGGSIPFTVIKKGEKVVETVGMMSKEDLNAKLNSFK